MDLFGLVRSLKEQGLQTPCLFRFPDIVNQRITQLQGCFDKAIDRYEYKVSTRPAPACFHWIGCVTEFRMDARTILATIVPRSLSRRCHATV